MPGNAVRTLTVNFAAAGMTEVRLAARGLALPDRDHFAAILLTAIARDRWQQLAPALNKGSFGIAQDSYLLPGMFVMRASADSSSAARALVSARAVIKSLLNTPPSNAELEKAKGTAIALTRESLQSQETMADAWLDVDTYGLPSIGEQIRMDSAVSAADLQRVATRLFGEAPLASVVVGHADELKAPLSAAQKIEVMGEPAPPQAPAEKSATDAAPQKRRPAPILLPKKDNNPFLKKPATKPD